MSFKGVFYFKLWWPFCLTEWNNLSNFVRSPKESFCEIILKLVHWSRSRCHLKVFLFFCSGCRFVQQSRAILAILAKGNPRNIPVK